MLFSFCFRMNKKKPNFTIIFFTTQWLRIYLIIIGKLIHNFTADDINWTLYLFVQRQSTTTKTTTRNFNWFKWIIHQFVVMEMIRYICSHFNTSDRRQTESIAHMFTFFPFFFYVLNVDFVWLLCQCQTNIK